MRPGVGGPRLSHVWVVAALAFPVALVTASPLDAIDLAYQMRAGDLVLSTHGLLRTDPLTFSAAGLPWLNQQWGTELSFAVFYRAGGWLGLAVARALLTGAVLALVFLACRAAGASRRRAAWLTLGSALLIGPGGLQLRAQLPGMVCFAAVLWLVASRRQHARRLLWAIPIIVLWANLHGSFFLGPLLIGLGWLADLADGVPQARRTLLAGIAGLAATVVTPFGPRVWEYVVDISTNPLVRRFADEWQPPTLGTYLGAAFLVSGAAVAAYLARRGAATPWPALASLGVFFAIGLTATRGVVWWGLAMPAVLAGLPRREPVRAERPDPVSPANAAISAALVVVALGTFIRWLPYGGSEPPPDLLTFAPAGITRELRGSLAPGERLFNPQGWGSWFELELPGNPVFVDSRWEVVPERAWDDYYDLSLARQGWQDVLDRWGMNVAVLARDQQRFLIPIMRADPRWRLVYEDADGLIFRRR